jgi:hypothetical protein
VQGQSERSKALVISVQLERVSPYSMSSRAIFLHVPEHSTINVNDSTTLNKACENVNMLATLTPHSNRPRYNQYFLHTYDHGFCRASESPIL